MQLGLETRGFTGDSVEELGPDLQDAFIDVEEGVVDWHVFLINPGGIKTRGRHTRCRRRLV